MSARSAMRGFTLVELIITILLVGIVSAVVLSRLNTRNAFDGIVVRDQIVSMVRIAQQNAFGRADVELTVTPNGSNQELTIEASYIGGTIADVDLPMSSLTITGDINDTDSCGVTPGAAAITNATPMTFTFTELGSLGTSGVTGSTGTISSAVRICINDDPSLSVCVSPSGFAYAGDCDV